VAGEGADAADICNSQGSFQDWKSRDILKPTQINRKINAASGVFHQGLTVGTDLWAISRSFPLTVSAAIRSCH
jgi:hypothetical protein